MKSNIYAKNSNLPWSRCYFYSKQTARHKVNKCIVTTSMKPHFLGKMHQRVNNTNTMISTYTSISRSSSHFCLYILTSFFVIVTICVGFLWNIYTHWSQKCQCASGKELYKMYIFKWVSFYTLSNKPTNERISRAVEHNALVKMCVDLGVDLLIRGFNHLRQLSTVNWTHMQIHTISL